MVESVKQKSAARRVPFLARAEEAKDVRITGDFLRWGEEGIPLSHDGHGGWRTVLPLGPGCYQYRLLVDGEWRDHAEATERVANPYGTQNCVLKVV